MAQNNQACLRGSKTADWNSLLLAGFVWFITARRATFDLDICCPFGEENVRRIEAAVQDLHPVHRLTANKLPLEKTRSALPA